ncbi:DNA polymerase domain-containing protein [Natranaeroarchaeum aerophilus]|uniref:DNA polymerase n=1 Tax=Natranaeroarchaeum aerophilus TaxID=2917711 RepID=A0AAE3K4G8_9EURY|nr:DNA polymerase domain-containing protein [Natranaeroarchaeum aerophilus]MCL9813146.1 DNA polymerase [Natranaeroarchaeum aerophilus]
MTDDGQTGLAEFGSGEDDSSSSDGERDLAAEARAVAGDGDGSGIETIDPTRDGLDARYGEPTETIRLSVMQIDYTIAGRGQHERPIINVFGRDEDDDPHHVRVLGFQPYFYAPTDSLERPPEEEYDGLVDSDETGENGEPFESIRGEHLTKIYGRTPRDVGEVRDDFDHYEADILFPNRFLIDKDIQSGVEVPVRRDEEGALIVAHEEVEAAEMTATPRVNTFDLEVDDRHGFPEPDDAEQPIICLASHDSYDDEYILWLYDAPVGGVDAPEALAGYDPLTDEADYKVRSFDSEEAMLEAFLDYLEETDPDVTTGWNFEDFDAPYLVNRLENLGLASDRLSRVGEVWAGGWGGPDIKGRVVFDLLYAYKRTQFTELESYRLDAVGEQELGVGKERYTGDIGDLWEQDPEQLLEYNLRDVELCVELDRKQNIVEFWDEVRTFVGCKLEDAPTPGDAVDMYVLHKVHGNFALPSKGKHEGEDYEGGAVFDPITGVKENVTVLDLKCFSGDTDVLTPQGPRNITELDVDDEVYTLNPDTFECEIKPVVETHAYENRFGELNHLSGNTHDLKVTGNHRFLVSDERGWDEQTPEDFEWQEYDDIPEYERFAFPQHRRIEGDRPETFDLVDHVDGGNVVVYSDDDLRAFRSRVPDDVTESLELVHGSSAAMGVQKSIGKYLVPIETYRAHRTVIEQHADDTFLKYAPQHRETPCSFEMDDWLSLLGWYVTEGSADRAAGRVTIHQSDPDGREAIRSLLDRMGINYNTDDRGINISNQYLLNWLEDNCGDGYATKQLPAWVFDLDGELLEGLLETMIRGDGSRTESGLGKFWTKSDRLKDAAVDLAVRCGHKPTASKQDDGTWYVSVGKRGSFKKETNATVEDHDGDVYCITAKDNHAVLAGRNGNFQWVGQSLYPMCMVTTNASPETKVDPDEYGDETYRAPNGTHFRKEPDGIIREMVDELLTERENKKELRNEHDPDSEAYARYDQQQGAVKVIMNCFTPDTDVLTPRGVENIRDLDIGDEVYSIDPDTLEMERKPVVETHEYPEYRGELVDIETSKIDLSVTPNHRTLVRKNDRNGITEDDWGFVEAGDLYECCNYEMPYDWDFDHESCLNDMIDLEELVRRHTNTPLTATDGGTKLAAKYGSPNVTRRISTDSFLELMAWYIAEGNVYEADTANYRIKIAQEDSKNLEHIESLIDSVADYHYVNNGRSVSFSSRVLADLLRELCGSGSKKKRIPEMVFKASKERKEEFLDVLIEGDGDRQKNSWRYSTTSKQLRDDVLRLCTHLGLTASYSRDSDTWRIYCTENGKNSFRMHRSGSRSTAENGVYCVTVADNNTLLAGRNGTFQNVGNSLYGVLGWDRFRLYDKEMGAAVTATGREVIEHTEDAANEAGHEVAYGDTDSVMLEIGHVQPDDVEADVVVTDSMRESHPEMSEEELESLAATIEKGYELEEQINGSYDEFALDQLNAEHHRFQIEFEKLYRRFFQAGKKKRYAGHIVWKEGKDVDDIDITGFEYQRSDIAQITKEVQLEVITRIVRGEDIEDVKTYVHDIIQEVQAGEVSLDEIGIPGGIGKKLDNYDTDTAQVRGAKYANELLGTNFSSGSKPKRVYLKKVHPDYFERMEREEGFDPQTDLLYGEFKRDPDVICFEYDDQIPEEFEIDYDKMLDKTLKGPIERVLEALDISWSEVKSGQEQTGLGGFM